MWFYIIIYLIICSLEIEIAANNKSVVITKYAKVARWGLYGNKTDRETTQDRRTSFRIGQGINTKVTSANMARSVTPVYQYPVYRRPSSKVDNEDVSNIPAIGEVIQERFNVKPYFGFGLIPPKNQDSATYGPPDTKINPGPVISNNPSNFDSFPPAFNRVPSSEKTPVDLYTSSYSSYNPSGEKQNSGLNFYPPLGQDEYVAPPSFVGQGEYDYEPPNKTKIPKVATLGPPLRNLEDQGVDAPPSNHAPDYINSVSPNFSPKYEEDVYDHTHGVSNMMNQQKTPKTADGPPNYPPKSIHDVYDPSVNSYGQQNIMMDHPKTQISSPQLANGPPHYPPKSEDDIYYPADFDNGVPAFTLNQQKPPITNPQGDMTYDLSPPISESHDSHFPPYLYDSHHFDNHVYEEIPHMTTTPATENRVSKTHYSYYYLGRKLWYIPLYFCIYFIIYVAILIIKAIARHKVQFKYDWISAHSRSARNMHRENATIDEIHRNVTTGLDKASKIYSHMVM